MLDEEVNETAIKAKAIAEIVEIAIQNLAAVDLTREEALAGILSQIAIQVEGQDLKFALDLNKKYRKASKKQKKSRKLENFQLLFINKIYLKSY